MIKKIALLVAMAFSLAAMAAAEQFPLPPGGGGGNIVLK
jgi:hypothetical protein